MAKSAMLQCKELNLSKPADPKADNAGVECAFPCFMLMIAVFIRQAPKGRAAAALNSPARLHRPDPTSNAQFSVFRADCGSLQLICA
jgi:hypothetical protein